MDQSKQKPHISVIIPAHNEEKYILKTLQSLANQEYRHFEIIVVLSACSDRTELVVQRFIRLRPELQISLIIEQELGVSKARNKGAKFAKGNLLFFLDADTFIDHNCLLKTNQYITSNYSIATCHSKPIPWSIIFSLIVGLKNSAHRLGLVKGVHGNLICWRGHFEKVGGYNENLVVMEHRDLIYRLLKLGRYKWIPTAFCTTSMRRWEKEGVFKMLFYWFDQGVKSLFSKKRIAKQYEAIR